MAEKLTAQQERFAQNIVKGLTPRDAYTDAGYKARGRAASASASRLLTNANVQARISELAGEVKTASIADAREIQEFWSRVLRAEETEELLTKMGSLVEARARVSDRLRAAEALAKMQGLFSRTDDNNSSEIDAIAEALRDD